MVCLNSVMNLCNLKLFILNKHSQKFLFHRCQVDEQKSTAYDKLRL